MKKIWLLLTLLLFPVIAGALPSQYQWLSAAQKQDVLWNNIVASTYSILPTEDSLLPNPALLDPYYLLATFTHTSDEMPKGRKKLIHAYGSVVKIELLISNPKYGGIFHSGGIGLARLSIARLVNAKTAFTPGMAIKFLVDQNAPSINLHAMNSVDGQGTNHFFFARAFSNILPEPQSLAGKIISRSFENAVRLLNSLYNTNVLNAGDLPLQRACMNGLCPQQIIFRPAEGSADGDGRSLENDFRKDLAKIPSGTVLYKLTAKETLDGPEEEIGYLITRSKFVASSYGDTKLFFQHAD